MLLQKIFEPIVAIQLSESRRTLGNFSMRWSRQIHVIKLQGDIQKWRHILEGKRVQNLENFYGKY
jgi:hypothetical protein